MDVENWVKETTGDFHYTKVLDGLVSPRLFTQLRQIMKRLKEKNIISPVSGKDGWWRLIDNSLEEVAWWESETPQETAIELPLNINNYCLIPRPSVIICAGKYNAGKSAFCINTVKLNIPKWGGNLDYYVSEGAELVKDKFRKLGLPMEAPCFRTFRRTENFADVINPDNLSIIDYLRVDMTQTYAVSEKIFEIFNKLKTGIALIAMQKPGGERKLAFGGGATAFEPSLYVGMETTGMSSGWLGFEKIKIPRQYGGVDPYSIKINYKIKNGAEFYDIREEM